jgi:hypothetical protein
MGVLLLGSQVAELGLFAGDRREQTTEGMRLPAFSRTKYHRFAHYAQGYLEETLMECTTIEIILAVARSLILVVAAASGTFCIYLGWRLYRDTVISKVSGEGKYNSFKFKFSSASPGIILAGFGFWLLVTIVQMPLDLSETREAPIRPSAMELTTSPKLIEVSEKLENAGSAPTQGSEPIKCLIVRKVRRLTIGMEPTVGEIDYALSDSMKKLRASANPGNESESLQTIDALDYLQESLRETNHAPSIVK